MRRRIVLVILVSLILATNSCAKHCYKLKYKQSCYNKYFNISSIHSPKMGEVYYQKKDGTIYTFKDNIEIQFKRIGAIINIEDDFEISFIDKEKKETYLYKIKNKDELFSIITNLNQSDYISKASPIKKRKLTKDEYKMMQEAKKASMKRRLKGVQDAKDIDRDKIAEYKTKKKAEEKKNSKKISNLKKGPETDLMW